MERYRSAMQWRQETKPSKSAAKNPTDRKKAVGE
jgi:hypothetical protein